ncbi:MAG: diguanylate cyclase [Ruminiclostridium sp.]|nr:diguanylate cyclase [Ruminiclostridium sp.]
MKKILIVDDNRLNLIAAKNVLNDVYSVSSVLNGEEALEYLERESCDLILLDINMPDMDGFEVFEKLRAMEKTKEIPVIFLTADNDANTETHCFDCGAIDFIAKPFVPAVMRSRISRVLELEELRKSLADRLEKKTQEVTDMKSKSQKDALTGLWNRSYTEDAVNKLFAEGSHGALMMIDMDNFKAINDNYGHIAGDRTLIMFADTLREYCGTEDVLCRIGGDEFVAFVRSAKSKSELSNLAADILSDLCRKLDECKFDTNSSVSIGIAQFPDDGTDFKDLYNAADKALYYVKQNGKNSFHFFSDKSEAENQRAGKSVDLNYLREIMSRADGGNGAYLMEYESFHHVYNFIRRFVERNSHDVSTVLFTAVPATGEEPDVTEVETALELLEKAIYTSLRRVDVSTKYSSKQLVVILMDANAENGELVAQRIISVFDKLYTGGKIRMEYGIAQMDKNGKIAVNAE